ncbi:hypothetical protein CY34DRAFT_696547 [Suillus luteus UH-Slu-Lm8-n1]|uniref:Uncharacterized protein n=1 Tax=Suillus luteus UH-Slu-Lm8-n1 TaxID=930992 RepID=A0A0D0AH52_9AGAM|nr:hypothetical protein CY34DRAFT_696547 [Suillus luteus UH-Slu-Lm8-n1]
MHLTALRVACQWNGSSTSSELRSHLLNRVLRVWWRKSDKRMTQVASTTLSVTVNNVDSLVKNNLCSCRELSIACQASDRVVEFIEVSKFIISCIFDLLTETAHYSFLLYPDMQALVIITGLIACLLPPA